MTPKPNQRLVCWLLASVSLLGAAAGCGPTQAQLKIQDLTAENEQLKGDILDRDQQLNDALLRDGDAQGTIDDLDRQLASMRSERAKLKKDDHGWLSTPSFDMISISDSVLFASGKASLTSAGRTKLAQLASDIRSRYPDRDIYVFGHTDAQPIRKSKWKDNLELGFARSSAVVRTLSGSGIPNSRLIAGSCGEYRPIVTGLSDRNQPRNRRVEVYAVLRNASMADTTAQGDPND